MVVQYPYDLEALSITGGIKDDATGNYSEPTETWELISKCRDESGNGKKVTLTDNSAYEYSFLVQLPKGFEALKVGTTIRILSGLDVRCSGTVVYSRKDQLHTRLWV